MSPTTSYDWAGSSRVQDEARFDPKNPVYEYSSGSEAMAPLANVDSTLWDICHAALKQVFWTLPISPTANQISYDGPEYDGDPDTLEAYVEGLVSQAALLSPLFRHYIPKHAPSESLVCDSIPDPPYAPDGTVAYADYTYSGIAGQTFTILQGATLPTFPTHDYRKFALGTARCPCGWPITGNGLCQAPAGAACAAVKAALGQTGCAFSPANYSIVAASIDSAVATNTNCPEFEIGPHFGFLDPAANEQWLIGTTQLTANTTDLLIHGRAGFRAGSLRQLQSTSKSQINPAARNATIDSARLTTCDTPSTLPTIDIIDGFVDELFPMSQGVEEAGAVAYCLRYVIEVARYKALLLALPQAYETSVQSQIVGEWRRRCGAQVKPVSTHVSNRVLTPFFRFSSCTSASTSTSTARRTPRSKSLSARARTSRPPTSRASTRLQSASSSPRTPCTTRAAAWPATPARRWYWTRSTSPPRPPVGSGSTRAKF